MGHSARRLRDPRRHTGHMTIRVTAAEVKAKIRSLLDEVESGKDVEITRHGRPIARILPAAGPWALKDAFKGIARSAVRDEDLYDTGVTWGIVRRRPR